MRPISTIAVGIAALPFILSPLAAAAPRKRSAGLQECVAKVLNGSDAANRIIDPSDATYEAASTGAVIQSAEFPALIVYATSVDEISPLVKCGTANNYTVTPRSGSHHFENWSSLNNTLVVDISHIDYVNISNDAKTAAVGAGARLGTIYSLLGATGQTINGGDCPSVGIGGYLGVGGYNMQMRYLGMAVDHVKSVRLVLADGSLVTASATENPDLFWAIRGGGTYGFVVEITIETVSLPRSAMLWANFTQETRNEATQKHLDWASKQDPLFNSQLNLHGNYALVLGWYVGKTVPELTALVNASGLMDIKDAQIKITGDCSFENSRNLWLGTQTECTDDATAHKLFSSLFNVVPDDLAPISGVTNFAFDDTPALPNEPKAMPWPRTPLIGKTYFVTKSKPLTEEIIQYITEKSADLPPELAFWGEMPTFNISVPATSAFAWQSEATYLFRFQVTPSKDANVQAIGQKFMDDLDAYLVPKIGSASYAGYMDAHISSDPHTAYWGNNVCKLSAIKKQYDPQNLFSNPFSIGPSPPAGQNCGT